MSFSETDRMYIRKFIGTGALFIQAFPLIESAITNVQALGDGGTRVDSSTENQIKGLIYGVAAVVGTAGIIPNGVSQPTAGVATPAIRGIIQIDSQIASLDAFLGTTEAVGDAKIDAYREMARLRSQGQKMCEQIATALGMKRVIRRYFYQNSDDGGGSESGEDVFLYSRYW